MKSYRLGIKRNDKWGYTEMVTYPDVLKNIIVSYIDDDTIQQLSIVKKGEDDE